MKIERGSVTITSIPLFERIEVAGTAVTFYGPGMDAYEAAWSESLYLADVEALRDALSEVIRIKKEIDGTPVAPRVFTNRTAEPDDAVTKVRDHEDDLWRCERGAWYLQRRSDVTGEGDGAPWSWEQLVSTYGPLTEER